MIQERVRAGLRGPSAREAARPASDSPELEERIRKALATPGRPGVRVIAAKHGVSVNTVQRIGAVHPFVASPADASAA